MKMPVSAADIARDFDLKGYRTTKGDSYNEIHQKLDFYQRTHYAQYLPTVGPDYFDYETRLLKWLNNVSSDDDKRTLFELAERITFFSREDLIKLHQAAFKGPITRWIINQLKVGFTDPDLDRKLQEELHLNTWFTAVTDSLQIADFHHANNLGGFDFRPDWRSLAKFADKPKIANFMSTRKVKGIVHPVKRIVILEDFIGSGTQMKSGAGSVAFAADNFPTIPILLVSLIICPAGAEAARDMVKKYPNVSFEAMIELNEKDLISDRTSPIDLLGRRIKNLVSSSYSTVIGDGAEAPRPYTMYGFAETGASLVLYTNTPANTLPVIQHGSSSWTPLFPRSARVR